MNSRRVVGPLVLLAAAAACSSPVAPRQGVTLMVINETCTIAVECTSFEVYAFPSVQPRTPGGAWRFDLGLADLPRNCFALPPNGKFRVTDAGSGKTTTFSWNDRQRLTLAAVPVNTPASEVRPTSAAFVPAAAGGWTVGVPSDSAITKLAADSVCDAGTAVWE